jgi:hypothetical protein
MDTTYFEISAPTILKIPKSENSHPKHGISTGWFKNSTLYDVSHFLH